MKKYAIIVAAGLGRRVDTRVPKQFLLLRNKPVLWYTLNVFLQAYENLEIILVLAEEYFGTGEDIIQSTHSPHRIKITKGGETRFHSVKNGLTHVPGDAIVFVHDGVRCLVTERLIRHCYEMTLREGNAIPSTGPIDSTRIETANGNEMVDRNKVHLIQTPQTFYSNILKAAFEQDYLESFTDEASVAERYGVKINLVEGETDNIKITRPTDLIIAEKILEERARL